VLTLPNTNALTGARNVRVTNRGNVVLAAPNNYTGSTTVDAGSTMLLQANLTNSPNVTIAGTAELAPGAGNNRLIKTTTLSVPVGGRLNVQDNKVIVTAPNSVGTASGGIYSGISGLIQSGRNGGGWGGSGIVTSQSGATSGNFTSIGVATAAQIKSIATTATATWAGQTVTGTDTLVMYTYGGDANLDGKINVDDYGHIDSSVVLPGVSGWFNGDFNYDGKINVDDYGIIDFNIGIQGAPFFTAGSAAPAGFSAVPEPACGVVLLTAACGGRAIRRRRRTQFLSYKT